LIEVTSLAPTVFFMLEKQTSPFRIYFFSLAYKLAAFTSEQKKEGKWQRINRVEKVKIIQISTLVHLSHLPLSELDDIFSSASANSQDPTDCERKSLGIGTLSVMARNGTEMGLRLTSFDFLGPFLWGSIECCVYGL
jgi:hypothetical protein